MAAGQLLVAPSCRQVLAADDAHTITARKVLRLGILQMACTQLPAQEPNFLPADQEPQNLSFKAIRSSGAAWPCVWQADAVALKSAAASRCLAA